MQSPSTAPPLGPSLIAVHPGTDLSIDNCWRALRKHRTQIARPTATSSQNTLLDRLRQASAPSRRGHLASVRQLTEKGGMHVP